MRCTRGSRAPAACCLARAFVFFFSVDPLIVKPVSIHKEISAGAKTLPCVGEQTARGRYAGAVWKNMLQSMLSKAGTERHRLTRG